MLLCNYFPAHPIYTNCMSMIIKWTDKKTLIVLFVHKFQVKYVIWERLLVKLILCLSYETVMSGIHIYQLHCQRHLINVLTYYSCPHTTCITAEPLDVMVNTAQYILNVLGWRFRGIKHEGLNLNKNTWYKHFHLKKSTNKPPNKKVYCIMWTLIETLLILFNVPRLYFIRHFLLLF